MTPDRCMWHVPVTCKQAERLASMSLAGLGFRFYNKCHPAALTNPEQSEMQQRGSNQD